MTSRKRLDALARRQGREALLPPVDQASVRHLVAGGQAARTANQKAPTLVLRCGAAPQHLR
jgi:hypothetical protein